MGLLADRNLFLLLLKRGPCLIIKTFPVFLALFLSPHIPNSVSGLIFLSQPICLNFLSGRSDVSRKHRRDGVA